MVVIVVEQLSLGIDTSRLVERFADVVINLGPWRGFDTTVGTVLNSFVNDVPCKRIVTHVLHHLLDILVHELLKSPSTFLIVDEARIVGAI